MVLLEGPLLKWCGSYIQRQPSPPQLGSSTIDQAAAFDCIGARAKPPFPSEISVVRALERQVSAKMAGGLCLSKDRGVVDVSLKRSL
jgi:hypothetical protein